MADSLLTFFHRETTATPWYVNHTIAVPAAAALPAALSVAPNPAAGVLDVSFVQRPGTTWRLELVDVAGRRVALLGRGVGTGSPQAVRWNAHGVEAGVYWVRLDSALGRTGRTVTLMAR